MAGLNCTSGTGRACRDRYPSQIQSHQQDIILDVWEANIPNEGKMIVTRIYVEIVVC